MSAEAYDAPIPAASVPSRRLWFGLLAAPAALVLHEVCAASLAGWACAEGDLAFGPLSGGGVRLVLAALTLLALAMALAGGPPPGRGQPLESPSARHRGPTLSFASPPIRLRTAG